MTSLVSGLVLLSVCTASIAILPFGTDHGDEHIAADNKGYIALEFEIDINGERYGRVKVYSSGYIGMCLSESLDQPQHSDARIEVLKKTAASNLMDLYSRVVKGQDIVTVVTVLTKTTFDPEFAPNRALIATWINKNEPANAQLSTIQCVVLSDGYKSHALFMENAGNQDPVAVQLNPPPTTDLVRGEGIFQLRYSGKCLAMSSTTGYLTSCSHSYTKYYLVGQPGYQSLPIIGTTKCLDREHCHSSTSNLRFSECNHCGAIHWHLWGNGVLTEDKDNNCIFTTGDTAAVHHTELGCTRFSIYYVGYKVQFRSIAHGDCLAGSVFKNCDSAPQYTVSGLPGNYQIRDTASGDCLNKMDCDSSSSSLQHYYDCQQCGATQWSLSGTQLGKDGMRDCVNRGTYDSAMMKPCSESSERMVSEVIPSVDNFYGNKSSLHDFPEPDVPRFIENLPSIELKGLRLYRDQNGGTARFEVVHFLPLDMRFPVVTENGVYQVQYWVTDIRTSVPYEDTLVPGRILDWVSSSHDVITGMGLQYGAVDVANGEFGEIDGVLSLFVRNDDSNSVEVPFNDELLSRLVIDVNSQDWWLTAPRVHFGTYKQTYYTFIGKSSIYQALYWSQQK